MHGTTKRSLLRRSHAPLGVTGKNRLVSRHIAIDPPPQIADLPQDNRGYHVPAEAPWLPEGPRLAGLDPHRTAALGFRRACTVCGFLLAEGRTVWRNLSQKDAAHARVTNSAFDVDPGMAGHLSCMIYSAFACPYWSSPVGRLGKDSAIQPGAPRGTRPAVLGFEEVLLMTSDDISRPFLGGAGSGATNALFGYVELVADHPFKQPQDLFPVYDTALSQDLADMNRTGERAYWTASATDQDRLTETLDAGMRAMVRTEPIQAVSYNDEDWSAFAVPLV